MYGLLEQDIQYILKAIQTFEEIESAILFGSRAMGNNKKGSDVDIAIRGKKVTDQIIFQLDDLLNEVYPLPYFFDIVHFEKITNQNLVEHIKTYGKILYQKDDRKTNSRRTS